MPYSQLVGIPGAPGSVGVNETPQDNSIALLGATTAAMNLYVDPVVGLDTNPGTSALPLHTINAALAAVPQSVRHDVVINLASGLYAESIYAPALRLHGGTLSIQSIPIIVAGQPRRTASVGLCSATTIGTLLAGWAVNSLRGYWVNIVSGMGSGQIFPIAANTADTITIQIGNSGYTTVPDGTSQYEIQQPGAELTGIIPAEAVGRNPTIVLSDTEGSAYRPLILQWLKLSQGGLLITGTVNVIVVGCSVQQMYLYNSLGNVTTRLIYRDSLGNLIFGTSYGCYLTDDVAGSALVAMASRSLTLGNAVIVGGITFNDSNMTVMGARFCKHPSFSTKWIVKHGSEVLDTAQSNLTLDALDGVTLNATPMRLTGDFTMLNCAGGLKLDPDCMLRVEKLLGSGNTGPVVTLTKSTLNFDNLTNVTATATGGGLYKVGVRPLGTAWADLTTYGPDDDGADQKSVGTVPGGGGDIALGRALNGMLASGLVRCHDLTAGVVLAEAAPAPGAGTFSVNYTTGAVTFNVAEAGHIIAIYYRPVSYTGARIG